MISEKQTDIIYSITGFQLPFGKSDYLDEFIKLHLGGLGNCIIKVKGNEGPIPHFHLEANIDSKVKGYNGNFESCICIYQPLYFNHGKYRDKLDKDQKKVLNDFLSKPAEYKFIDGSNWQLITTLWELAGNQLKNVPKNPVQPDYTIMENMI